jgi:hypothetical protein
MPSKVRILDPPRGKNGRWSATRVIWLLISFRAKIGPHSGEAQQRISAIETRPSRLSVSGVAVEDADARA